MYPVEQNKNMHCSQPSTSQSTLCSSRLDVWHIRLWEKGRWGPFDRRKKINVWRKKIINSTYVYWFQGLSTSPSAIVKFGYTHRTSESAIYLCICFAGFFVCHSFHICKLAYFSMQLSPFVLSVFPQIPTHQVMLIIQVSPYQPPRHISSNKKNPFKPVVLYVRFQTTSQRFHKNWHETIVSLHV